MSGERVLLKQLFGGTPNKLVTTDGLGNVIATQDLPSIRTLTVADIDDPSAELASESGTAGAFILTYEVNAATDEYTIYSWDAADSGSSDIPFVNPDDATGFWVAVAGKYTASGSNVRGQFTVGGNFTVKINGVVNVPVFGADPGSLADGDIWAVDNGTFLLLKAQSAGVTKAVELTTDSTTEFGAIGTGIIESTFVVG